MAGKAHVVIFVEGDTDKLLFDALVRYYRQQYGAGIASCEVRNLHGVSRYMSKVSGKLVAALDLGVIREKRASALKQLEAVLGVPEKKKEDK